MTSLCRHLFAAGRRCTQPAVRTTLYCRHHQVIKLALAKVEPQPDPYGIHKPLPFVFPEDRAALQINFMLVIQALNDRRISIQFANAFNRLLRSCETNLKKGPLHKPTPEKKAEKPARRNPNEAWLTDDDDPAPQHDAHDAMVRTVILTPEGEEIAPICEVPDEDEEESHGETCSCHNCAEQYRNAAPERHHPRCACGQCEKSHDSASQTSAPAAESITAAESIFDPFGEQEPDLEKITRAEQWMKERTGAASDGSAPAAQLPQGAPGTEGTLRERFHKTQFAAAAIAAGLGPEAYESWN